MAFVRNVKNFGSSPHSLAQLLVVCLYFSSMMVVTGKKSAAVISAGDVDMVEAAVGAATDELVRASDPVRMCNEKCQQIKTVSNVGGCIRAEANSGLNYYTCHSDGTCANAQKANCCEGRDGVPCNVDNSSPGKVWGCCRRGQCQVKYHGAPQACTICTSNTDCTNVNGKHCCSLAGLCETCVQCDETADCNSSDEECCETLGVCVPTNAGTDVCPDCFDDSDCDQDSGKKCCCNGICKDCNCGPSLCPACTGEMCLVFDECVQPE